METIASTGCRCALSDNATTRAIAWLTAWDSQDIHRTATVGCYSAPKQDPVTM
jgi:hypothetical protein